MATHDFWNWWGNGVRASWSWTAVRRGGRPDAELLNNEELMIAHGLERPHMSAMRIRTDFFG